MEVVLTSNQIHVNVMRFAKQIDLRYPKEPIVLLAVLDGGMQLTCDLSKVLYNYYNRRDVFIETICLKSYSGTERGDIEWIKRPSDNFLHKHVVIVDDINDSGNTIIAIKEALKLKHPKSIISCVMLQRENSTLQSELSGRIVQDGWFVGYGMDDNNKHRSLPYIYKK
jgi:hypoxanthine phosphoribosyltransferase